MTSAIKTVAINIPAAVGTFGTAADTTLIDPRNRAYEYQGTPGDIVDLWVTADGVNFSPFISFQVAGSGKCDAINLPDASGECKAFLRAGVPGGTFAVSGNDITQTIAPAAAVISGTIPVAAQGLFGAPFDVTALTGLARCYAYQGFAGDIIDLYSSSDGVNYSPLITFQGAHPQAVTIPDGSGKVKAFTRAKVSVLASTFGVLALNATTLVPASSSAILSDNGQAVSLSYTNATGGFTTVVNEQVVSVNGHVKVEATCLCSQTAQGAVVLQIIDLTSSTVIASLNPLITIPGTHSIAFKGTANLSPGVNRNWALQAQNTGGQTLSISNASLDIYDLAASFS